MSEIGCGRGSCPSQDEVIAIFLASDENREIVKGFRSTNEKMIDHTKELIEIDAATGHPDAIDTNSTKKLDTFREVQEKLMAIETILSSMEALRRNRQICANPGFEPVCPKKRLLRELVAIHSRQIDELVKIDI